MAMEILGQQKLSLLIMWSDMPVEVHQEHVANLKTRVDIKGGNRMKTSFCGDNWLGNDPLK